MITKTLVANNATVYIIGPKQADLDKIAKTFNDVGKGKIIGLEGDVREKVCGLPQPQDGSDLVFIVRSHQIGEGDQCTREICDHLVQ